MSDDRPIITWSEAVEKRLKRYFTGELCERSHLSERTTSGRKCLECARLHAKAARAADPSKNREATRRSRLRHLDERRAADRAARTAAPEKFRERARKWGAENREKQAQRRRERDAADPERTKEARRRYRANQKAKPGFKEKKDASFRAWKVRNAGSYAEYQAAYRKANRELLNKRERIRYKAQHAEIREKARLAYLAKRDAIRAASAEFRARNREKVRLAALVYRRQCREAINERARTQYYMCPGKKARIIARNANRGKAEGKFTDQDVARLFDAQKARCPYCPADLSGGFHIDHIMPLSKGGTNWPSNLQLTCGPCNLSKGDLLPEEFARKLGRLL